MRIGWIVAAMGLAVALAGFAAWRFVTAPGAHIVLQLDPEVARAGDVRATMASFRPDVQERTEGFDALAGARVTIVGDRFVIEIGRYSDLVVLRRAFAPRPFLSFQLVDDNAGGGVLAADDVRLRNPFPSTGEGPYLAVHRFVLLSGRHLTSARADFDAQTGTPAVTVRFDPVGAEDLARITRRYVGKRIAIVLDGTVLSAPFIREPITRGSLMINGNFTTQQSSDLAVALNASGGEWPFTVVEARKVER